MRAQSAAPQCHLGRAASASTGNPKNSALDAPTQVRKAKSTGDAKAIFATGLPQYRPDRKVSIGRNWAWRPDRTKRQE
jgi:hypothetical protein